MMKNDFYAEAILTNQISDEKLSQAYALMNEERRLRCDKMRADADKRACICADMLIRKLAKEHFGIDENALILSADEKGKPFIKGASCYVSISHSGEAVLCGISGHPMGVDIEKICDIPQTIAQKVGTTFESEEQFFRFWTAAESYGKLYGKGVWWALKQDFLNDEACRFEQVPCPDGYVATVCIKR